MSEDACTTITIIGVAAFGIVFFLSVFLVMDIDFKDKHPNWRDHEDFIP